MYLFNNFLTITIAYVLIIQFIRCSSRKKHLIRCLKVFF